MLQVLQFEEGAQFCRVLEWRLAHQQCDAVVCCENSIFHGIAPFYRPAFQVYCPGMKTAALIVLCAAPLLHAQDYALGPDSQPQAGVPKGTVTRLKLEPGKFYPGTPHNYSIYVPAQYDAAKPAPFMIFLDGSGSLNNSMRVPVVFDNLIAKHDLPPLIGIFIDPGVLPALSDEAQNRFERVFEYDSMSDRYSRFLLEELIPEVAKKYNLSKDPNDRAISGVSTGAVGAFMAAWNRPDQFHRVLSFIGTYVAMKGADGLPALIRKTEPKPIRIFLQDGNNDHVVPSRTLRHLLRRKLAHQQPGDVRGLPIRGLRRQTGDRRRGPQHETGRRHHARGPALVVARLPGTDRRARTRRHRHSPAGTRAAKSIPSSRPTSPGSRWARPTAPSPAPPATKTAMSSSPTPPPIASTSRIPTAR